MMGDVTSLSFGPANVLLVVVVIATTLVVASFSARSLDNDGRRQRYMLLVAGVAAGSSLVIVAGSLPLLVVGWLLSGWSLVGLIGFANHLSASRLAQREVAGVLAVGDVALLLAVLIAALFTDGVLAGGGVEAVADLREETIVGVSALSVVAVLLVIAGASRSSLFPFHRWLLRTLIAPTPVSALVHAGLVSGAGLLLLRFAPIFVASTVALLLAAGLAVLTIALAATASRQRVDVKGALVWSTVGQMAFMVVQCAVGAFSSAIVHIAGHGMYKAALFLGAGDTVSSGLRTRRSPGDVERWPGRFRMVFSASVAALAVAAAVLVIPPAVSDAGRVLIVVFAWLSIASAVDGWLSRGPFGSGVAAAIAGAVAVVSAFVYVGGLRVAEELLKPSLENVPVDTVIGPYVVVSVIVGVAVLVGLASLPGSRSAAVRQWWSTLVLSLTTARLSAPLGSVVIPADLSMSAAESSSPLRRAEVRADAAKASDVISPQWPLASFVAVNPLGGLESVGFEEATSTARRLLGAKTHLTLDEFRDDHERGLTTAADLEYVVHEEYLELCARDGIVVGERVLDVTEVIVADLLHSPGAAGDSPAAAGDSPGAAGDSPGLSSIDEILASWIMRFVQSPDKAANGSSFTAYCRGNFTADPRTRRCLDEPTRGWLSQLGDDAATMLDAALQAVGVNDVDRADEIRRHLCHLPGWSGLAKWRNDWAHGDELLPLITPLEIAAIRATLEIVIAKGRVSISAPGVSSDTGIHEQRTAYVAASLAASPTHDDLEAVGAILREVPAERRASLWLRAQERNLDRRILELVDRTDPGPDTDPPRAQAVFCIDVRSEGLRNELEAIGEIETIGFAGFFGVPMKVQELGWSHHEARCPVLVSPAIAATEHPRPQAVTEVSKGLLSGRLSAASAAAEGSTKRVPGAGFAFAEGAGWLTGPRAAWRTFSPGARPPVDVPATRLVLDDDEVLLEQRVFFAESVLRTMGLSERFAPVVVLCGHTSNTINNAHATALECGACAGASGQSNARAVAALLNSADVRQGLSDRGIEIPDETWFVPAVHDTASDDVVMFDLVDAPESHRDELEWLNKAFELAGPRNAQRRAAHLPGSSKRVRDRGADWAQVRPEWGLASNASFIIGPRSMTAGLDLGGRAFLHEYEATSDPQGRVLETIMTAPLVVGHWISSQYYFSTVDPEVFGAGDKLLHNPVGTTGVITGEGGDLRVGLPLQSTHVDGERFHQPVRLLAIIQADLEQIESTIAANPVLQSLTSGEWIRIAARSHRHEPWSMRTSSGTWISMYEPPRGGLENESNDVVEQMETT